MFKPTSPNTQKAFTLVELLTVMVVLVALASITVKSTAQFSFDSRYQITEDRYNKIKTAILGNPNQTINGHPSVSGFVADMGRLPSCLRELIDGTNCHPNSNDAGYCSDGTNSNQVTCLATTGNFWKDKTYQIDDGHCSDNSNSNQATCLTTTGNKWIISGLGFGWRGAYIETPNDPAKQNAFTDGWGRKEQCFNATNQPDYHFSNKAACEANTGYTWVTADDTYPDYNYGWIFDNSVSNQLTIKSYGKDGMLDGSEEYDKDYPQNTLPTVSINEWLVTPTVVNVAITPKIYAYSPPPITRPADNSICTANSGVWSDLTTPKCVMPLEYKNSLSCTAATGTWETGDYCSLVVPPLNMTTCVNNGGNWNGTTCYQSISSKQICLDLYYRENGIIKHVSNNNPPSNPQITENGMTQIVSFSLTAANIPVGKAAFRITDCGAIPAVYPIPTRPPQIVNIMPNAQTLDFTW